MAAIRTVMDAVEAVLLGFAELGDARRGPQGAAESLTTDQFWAAYQMVHDPYWQKEFEKKSKRRP